MRAAPEVTVTPMTTLSLMDVPAPRFEKGRFSASHREQLREWLDGLPRGHPVTCCRQLLEALSEANRAPLNHLGRLAFTEFLRPAVYESTEALARRYATQPLPLPQSSGEESDLARRLLDELAAGFKLAVNEILQQRKVTRESRLDLQIASQRALLAHGRGLVETYRVHAPEPAGCWSAIHRLYRNAEALQLQALPIEGARDAEETLLSIRQAYLRLAILALTNPYHLMQDEAQDLYRRIGRWVHFAHMRELSGEGHPEGRFITDLDSDLPPRYVSRQNRGVTPANPRELDVAGVVEVLDKQIENLAASLQERKRRAVLPERLQHDLYTRFREALGGRQERSAPRSPTVSRLHLVSGISACHYMLNDRAAFNPQEDERRWIDKVSSLTPPTPATDLSLADKDSYLNPAHRDSLPGRVPRFRGFDAELDDVWQKANRLSADEPREQELRPDLEPQPWSRKNESRGGMALFCPRDSETRTRVGELVAWANAAGAGGQDWSLGVVRWLRTRDHRGLELGVQQLGESGYAAAARAVRGTGEAAGYVRVIITPRVNPVQGNASLILPAAVFDTDSLLALNLHRLVVYAALTEVLETTRQFTHFRFRLTQAPDVARGS